MPFIKKSLIQLDIRSNIELLYSKIHIWLKWLSYLCESDYCFQFMDTKLVFYNLVNQYKLELIVVKCLWYVTMVKHETLPPQKSSGSRHKHVLIMYSYRATFDETTPTLKYVWNLFFLPFLVLFNFILDVRDIIAVQNTHKGISWKLKLNSDKFDLKTCYQNTFAIT